MASPIGAVSVTHPVKRYAVTHETARRGVVTQRVDAVDVDSACAALRLAPEAVLLVRSEGFGSGIGQVNAEPVDAPRALGLDAPAGDRVRRWLQPAGAFPLRLFSQELAVLLDAGIPLLEALRTLREKESAVGVARVLDALIAGVRDGRSLSFSAGQQPAFGPLFIATVEASERTGQLALALRRHAGYLAWVEGLRGKLVQAAVYPAMLLAAGLAVLLFLLLFVVPRFAGLLDGMQGDLPWASSALLTLGAVAGGHPWWVLAAALAALAVPWLGWRQPSVRRVLGAQARRLPWIGPRMRLLALATLYRTTGMLLAAGVPLVASLGTAAGVLGGPARAALGEATARVRAGGRLSDALDAAGLCTPVSLRMIRVGERTGQLGDMLERAAAFHDEALANSAELAARVVNPLLMLAMGVVIGGVVVLLYLPIFQLAEQVQ